jgi:peptidoglycan hydrolase-like protein with peptidoglycan-binding domain
MLGLAVVIPVLALRGGDQATVTPLPEPTSTTPASTETGPSEAPSTTPTTPTTQAPAAEDAPALVLPEGVKLQREGEGEGEGEGDPALIRDLQQALVSAGFDPGPADGTFGRRTEAAVVAFQQANGLSVDGRVGPETAEALNRALASG